MWNPLLDERKIGRTLPTAWIAKENLRTLVGLARTGTARWNFPHLVHHC